MKNLIILAHPDIKNSIINKRFLKEAAAQNFTVRDLAREYPSDEIDGERERTIIKAHDALVLQFPLHNFSSPAILKSWIDATMTYGFAYGRTSEGMRGRAVALAEYAEFLKNLGAKSGAGKEF